MFQAPSPQLLLLQQQRLRSEQAADRHSCFCTCLDCISDIPQAAMQMQVSCSNSLLYVMGDTLLSVQPDYDSTHLC